MNPSELGMAAAAVLVLLLSIRHSLQKRKERKQRDFDRKLETVLQPRETVKVICPQKKGRWILTSKRLLLDESEGFHAIPFDKIKSTYGQNEAGNRTTSIPKMVSLTVKAEREYHIRNTSDQFPELAKQLLSKVKTHRQKTKGAAKCRDAKK